MPPSSTNFDVIIIGAGAAGLIAAGSASQRGKRTLLLEKNRKLGVKILMSGGTRCNITHHCDTRGIIAAFGPQGNFLHSALAAFPPQEIINLLHAHNVETKVEPTGKIFPVSNRAIDVRDALVQHASQNGAQIISGTAVRSIKHDSATHSFAISSDSECWTSPQVIVTTGGRSYPGCGTTGDGYAWAKNFGHSIVPTVPALVPLLNSWEWAHELKGITIEKTDVAVWDPDAPTQFNKKGKAKKQKPLARRKGSFLFTHWGFSGPSVLDVSRAVARHDQKRKLQMECDFLPSIPEKKLLSYLSQKKSHDGKQSIANLLSEFHPRRLTDALLTAAGLNLTQRNAEISKIQTDQIVSQLKRCRFPIDGTLGFEKAEVTAGGIALSEVDSRTMESKLQPGLFFAGEILDLDGFIGGFNFQSAFSTGYLAGQSIA